MSTKQLNIDILARDKTKQALSGVQKNLTNVKNTVFSLKGALVGLGAGAVVKSFVDVGKEVESLQIRFKFLFGSVEEGQIAFDNLTKFASKVPFSLEEISRASGNLAVVADDANDLNRILEITGNVASVTGLDFETTASQIQRAFSGGIASADIFRERGVRALLGFKAGATITAEETVARFEELFAGDGRFANATDDLATTLEGTLSMIGDKYFKFQKDVASGFFDELKGEFGDLNTFLEENEQQIKDIATAIGENFAGALTTTSDLIKAVAPSVKTIADALGTTIEGFKSLPTFVQTTGIIGALLFGKKGAIAFAGVSFLVGQIDKLIEKSGQLKTQDSLIESLGAGEIDPFSLSLEELEVLIERIGKTDLSKGRLSLELNDAEMETWKFYNSLKEVALTLRMAKSDAETYLRIQNSLNKITIKNTDKVDELANSFELASQQASAFGGAYIDAINKGTKELDIVTENKFPNFIKVLEDAGDTTSQLDGLFTSTFNNFSDTLADALMTGKFAFQDFSRAVLADIARIISRQLTLLAIQKALGFFGVTSIFGQDVGKILGFANGGRPPVGQPSIVGERGPELFVPDSAGTVIPNNQLGGTTNVNFTINAVDTRGFRTLLRSERGTIVSLINQAVTDKGREALV